MIRRTSGGGRIVAVGRSRLALDPEVVRGILVTEGTPGHFCEASGLDEAQLDRSQGKEAEPGVTRQEHIREARQPK